MTPALRLLQGGRSDPAEAAWSPSARPGFAHVALRALAWVALAVLVLGFLPEALRDLVGRLP